MQERCVIIWIFLPYKVAHKMKIDDYVDKYGEFRVQRKISWKQNYTAIKVWNLQ